MSMPMSITLPKMAEHMGISKSKVNGLSPEVKALSKSELIALGHWGGSASDIPDGLTLKDVNSIKELFGPSLGDHESSAADLACCCCPCCCASAVMKPTEDSQQVTLVA